MPAPGDRPDNQVVESGAAKSPPTNDARINAQIEQKADYYTPGVYATLLSFYHNIGLSGDPLSSQFIPLSTVPQRGRNQKMFVIGVLPPAARVTGRLLDRSASVASIEGIIPDLPGGARIEDIFGPPNDTTNKAVTKSGWGGIKASDLGQEFWEDYVGMCKRAGVDPIELAAIIYNESGFNAGAEAKSGEDSKAKGLIQNLEGTLLHLGLTPEQWDHYTDLTADEQLYFVEKFVKQLGVNPSSKRDYIYSKVFGGYPEFNPQGILYAGSKYQTDYIKSGEVAIENNTGLSASEKAEQTAKLQKAFPNPSYQGEAYEMNKGLDKSNNGYITQQDLLVATMGKPPGDFVQAIKDAQEALKGIDVPPPGNPFDGPSTGDRKPWQDDGSASAAAIRQQLYKIAKTGLNGTDLGERFQAAQRKQIVATQLALQKMQNTPPLRMLVNPSSFSVKGEKIVQDGNWGRNGPIIEHWGDNQDHISGSGNVAAFFALDATNASGPGITRMARNFSQGYQNFMSLYLFYRNNAGIYLPDSDSGNYVNLSLLGSIYLYYDNILYLGSFDSFNITEDDTKAFTLNYTFEFVVRAAFLLDRPSEQGFTYGNPALFVQSQAPAMPPAASADTGQIITGFDNADVKHWIANGGGDDTPQAPGNEPGAVRTKADIDAERARLTEKFNSGQIPQDYYYSQLKKLDEEEAALT